MIVLHFILQIILALILYKGAIKIDEIIKEKSTTFSDKVKRSITPTIIVIVCFVCLFFHSVMLAEQY